MKKNLFALLAVVTLAGSLAGCNPSTSGSGTGTGGKEYPDYQMLEHRIRRKIRSVL